MSLINHNYHLIINSFSFDDYNFMIYMRIEKKDFFLTSSQNLFWRFSTLIDLIESSTISSYFFWHIELIDEMRKKNIKRLLIVIEENLVVPFVLVYYNFFSSTVIAQILIYIKYLQSFSETEKMK